MLLSETIAALVKLENQLKEAAIQEGREYSDPNVRHIVAGDNTVYEVVRIDHAEVPSEDLFGDLEDDMVFCIEVEVDDDFAEESAMVEESEQNYAQDWVDYHMQTEEYLLMKEQGRLSHWNADPNV